MRVLLTGFEAFLGHGINPTERIVRELEAVCVDGVDLVTEVLPVAFSKSSVRLLELYQEVKPDAIVMLGLAAGRNRITPERVAINVQDGDVDNEGVVLEDAVIREDGPVAYLSTLPVRKIVNELKAAGLPAAVSNSAGTYLCNNVMYAMLDYLAERGIECPAGFVHIPASHELALEKAAMPSMSHEDLMRGVRIVVECLVR